MYIFQRFFLSFLLLVVFSQESRKTMLERKKVDGVLRNKSAQKFIEDLDLSQPDMNRHKFEHIYLRRAPI